MPRPVVNPGLLQRQTESSMGLTKIFAPVSFVGVYAAVCQVLFVPLGVVVELQFCDGVLITPLLG